MPVGRRIGLVMAMAVGLAGCRADGTGSLSMLPRRNPPASSFDLDGFVAEHNRNAEAIQSLKARPKINVAAGRTGVTKAKVEGHLAMERPRNFKLELEVQGLKKADIGSNAEKFWYWIPSTDKDQRWIYWCNYRDLESSDLPVTYQPDWIIEAMGLKTITARESAGIKVSRGPDASTTRLVFPPVRDRGEPYVREMIVSNADRRIKRVLLFTETPRTPIAESTSEDYQTYPAEGSGASGRSTCYLPKKVRLDWKREHLALDVELSEVETNRLDHAMAADIFVEPEMPGYSRLNLAEATRNDRNPRRPRTRQTIPPPDSGDEIHLGRPAPIPDDSPVVPKVGRRPTRPASDGDDPPLPGLEEVVGDPTARPPGGAGPLQSAALPGLPGRDSTIEQ